MVGLGDGIIGSPSVRVVSCGLKMDGCPADLLVRVVWLCAEDREKGAPTLSLMTRVFVSIRHQKSPSIPLGTGYRGVSCFCFIVISVA
jgi:hypothetical protein